jgi:hypothetical protein
MKCHKAQAVNELASAATPNSIRSRQGSDIGFSLRRISSRQWRCPPPLTALLQRGYQARTASGHVAIVGVGFSLVLRAFSVGLDSERTSALGAKRHVAL